MFVHEFFAPDSSEEKAMSTPTHFILLAFSLAFWGDSVATAGVVSEPWISYRNATW